MLYSSGNAAHLLVVATFLAISTLHRFRGTNMLSSPVWCSALSASVVFVSFFVMVRSSFVSFVNGFFCPLSFLWPFLYVFYISSVIRIVGIIQPVVHIFMYQIRYRFNCQISLPDLFLQLIIAR